MANKRIQDLEQTTNLTNDDLLPLDTTKKTFAITLKSLVEWLKRTFQTTANMVNYVKKTGDTMTGTLTNNGVFVSQFDKVNYIARSKTLVKGTTPADNKFVGYDWQDKNGARLVYLGVSYQTNGIKRLELQKLDSNLTEFLIGFKPIFIDNVTAQLNGNTRYKCICQGYTKGTAPTVQQFGGVSTYDKNNVEVATIYSSVSTENTVMSALWVKQPTVDGTEAKVISIYCDKNGVFHTLCSVPSAEPNSIVTTIAHSTNYMRFGNGLQICWGNSEVGQTIILPQPFKDANYKITFCQTDGREHNINQVLTDKTTTSFRFSRGYAGDWIALGYWY